MRAIKKSKNYLTFSIDEIGIENLNSLIQESFKISNKLSIDNLFEIDETPSYITQVAYPNGYVQDRYVYYLNDSFILYVLSQTEAKDAFDLFFCQYLCWDIFDNSTLILDINIVQGVVCVNSQAIDLAKYKNFDEGIFGDE